MEFVTDEEVMFERGTGSDQTKPALDSSHCNKQFTTVDRDEELWRITHQPNPLDRITKRRNSGRNHIEKVLDERNLQVTRFNWHLKDIPDSPLAETIIAVKDVRPQEIARTAVKSQGWGSLLFGCLYGDDGKTIPEVMLSGKLDPIAEIADFDGYSTRLIKSKCIFGQHNVWLDPDHGYLPRRIEVLKIPGDRLNDKVLLTEADANHRREEQKSKRKSNDLIYGGEVRLLIHRIEIKRYPAQDKGKLRSAVEIPDSYEIECCEMTSNGTPAKRHISTTLSDLELY